jgi:hypothetical protein
MVWPVMLGLLAVRLGWHDEVHFINDFGSFVGCAPAEYLARTRC